MSTRNQSLFEAILARISFGSVPVDGMYWFDPKGAVRPEQRGEPRARRVQPARRNPS
jgi:hypothetical protein